jgi:hypothetical protein
LETLLQGHGQPNQHEEAEISIPRDQIYLREPLVPIQKYYPSYVIWTKDVNKVLDIFDKTILNCPQKIDVAIYHPSARFFFVVDQPGVLNGTRPEEIFAKVAAISDSFYFSRLGIFFGQMTRPLKAAIMCLH